MGTPRSENRKSVTEPGDRWVHWVEGNRSRIRERRILNAPPPRRWRYMRWTATGLVIVGFLVELFYRPGAFSALAAGACAAVMALQWTDYRLRARRRRAVNQRPERHSKALTSPARCCF